MKISLPKGMGDHKSHIRHEDSSHVERAICTYRGSHMIPVSYKVSGTIKFLFHIKYGETIRAIDSYKVSSNLTRY